MAKAKRIKALLSAIGTTIIAEVVAIKLSIVVIKRSCLHVSERNLSLFEYNSDCY
jgi:hypothetical protein